MNVAVLIGVMGCLAVVAVYFWLVRKETEEPQQ
jgi:hypothetical protein